MKWEENSEAARLWARLTGGLGRSQEDDWEDLDEESLGSEDSVEDYGEESAGEREEREKRIRIQRGRQARSAAREREKLRTEEVEVEIIGTSMPTRKDLGGKEGQAAAANQRDSRRTSIGRPGPVAAKSTESPSTVIQKRKNSLDAEQLKQKLATEATAAVDGMAAVDPNQTLLEMKALMQGLTVQMAGVREDIGDAKKDLGERIEAGSKATEELKKRMDKSDDTFADRVAAVVASIGDGSYTPISSGEGPSSSGASYSSFFKSTSDPNPGNPSMPAPSMPRPRMSKEDHYWMCRRSLRIWPVVGDDIRKALGDFIKSRLLLTPQFLADMGNISVKKVAEGPGSKIVGEVIAVFSTVEIRDAVRRAARELGGSSDAGIRLEIPQSMKPSLKALEAVSFNLKKKHPKIKRSIKFEDGDMDLILDFNTDPDANGPWRHVTAAQAKIMKSKMPSGGRTEGVTDTELELMMS